MKKLYFILFYLLFTVLLFPKERKIAIMELENSTSKKIDTKFITESIQTSVVSRKYFTVFERKMLNKILEERKLNLAGLTKEERATQVGLLSGAESIWIGSVSMLDDVYVITVKSLDLKSGEIEYADQVYCKDEKEFFDVVEILVERLYRKSKGENVENFISSEKPFKLKSFVQGVESNDDFSLGMKEGVEIGKKSGEFIYFIGGYLIPYGFGVLIPLFIDPASATPLLGGKVIFLC